MATSSKQEPGDFLRPLRSSTFRNPLLADVVSDVGTFMQAVGAAWLMVSLNGGPMYVALTQTASALPFFVLALPAGAVGTISLFNVQVLNQAPDWCGRGSWPFRCWYFKARLPPEAPPGAPLRREPG